MPDGDQQISAWPTIQPVWNTSPITQDFRRRWTAQFGDKRQAVRGQNGQILYPGASGGARMVRTLPGSDPYHRSTVAEGQPGAPTEREIPYAAQLREADQTPNDPFRLYRPSPNWSASGVDGSLARAAAIDAYKNSHEVSPENNAQFQGLRTGTEIMSDMAYRLSRIKNDDLSRTDQLKVDWANFTNKDLEAQGVKPDAIAFFNDLRRAKELGIFLPPTGHVEGGAGGENLFSNLISNSPKAALWTGLGNLLDKGLDKALGWIGKTDNLTALRQSLPQDLNKANQSLYDLVAHDPQGRWTQNQYDYVNRIAAQPGFSYGGDPYGESKAIPNPAETAQALGTPPVVSLPSQPDQAAPQQQRPQQPGQPQGQSGTPAVPGTTITPGPAPVRPAQPVTAQAPVSPTAPGAAPAPQNVPLGQRLLQTLGHFFTFSLGQHGPQATATPASAQTQPAGQPQPQYYQSFGYGSGYPGSIPVPQPAQAPSPATSAPRPAPVPAARPRQAAPPVVRRAQPVTSMQPTGQVTGAPTGPFQGPPDTQHYQLVPALRPMAMAAPVGRPGEDVEVGAPIGEASALTQAHVDRMEPGRTFVWHDGNTYVKT